MKRYIKFLKTVLTHKYYVFCEMCDYGLYWQGFIHDLSKFSPTEFRQARYHTGTQSPIKLEKQEKGYSLSWLHHIHHNKHHWEYWYDPTAGKIAPIPEKYIKEMVCDMIGASKAYLKGDYDPTEPIKYVENSSSHPDWLKAILIEKLKEKLR